MVAIGITAFYIVNLFGSKFMAKIQNYLSVILIAGLLLLGIFGVLNGLPDSLDITQEGYFLGGTDGFYQAVMVLMPSVYAASNEPVNRPAMLYRTVRISFPVCFLLVSDF